MAIRERSTRSGTCEMSWPAKRMVPCAHGTCRERMPTLLSELRINWKIVSTYEPKHNICD
eukprot:5716510-Pyramimonas_sp.AAC.1